MEAATEHYFEDAFARVGMTNCKPVVTPGVKRVAPAPDSQEARPLNSEEHSTYRQGVGKLQFIVERRPDLLYPLKEAGRQLANPREFDMVGLKRIMRYISGTDGSNPLLWFRSGWLDSVGFPRGTFSVAAARRGSPTSH